MKLNTILHNKQYKKGKAEEWKEYAKELTEYFDVNFYPIFYRLQRQYIEEGYRVCKKKGIKDIRYFWGVVKHHKKRVQTYKDNN